MKTERESPPSISEKPDKDKEAQERANWGNGVEFLMSCISMSVGLGNVWRFPFTAYENGGGAFLIPYICVLLFIGKPMYYLEMILGQFSSKSSIAVWCICPLFKGVGVGQMFGTISIITYYSSLLALTLYYFGVSFQAVLPWAFCKPEYGESCVNSASSEDDVMKSNFTTDLKSSSEFYFLRDVLHEKNDISDGLGSPDWKLTITLFVSWLVVFLVIMKGVKSSGKAAYFLALFPYVVLIALLVRAVTLEGAVDGIIFFLKPQWSELINLKVWKEAVVQCFFSLAVGLGPLIMFSSYNKFEHKIYRDAMIVTSLDTVTSLLAGITMFAILGNLAHNLNISNINEVVKSGTGLAFISYPDAIAKFQAVPQVFSVLFFFMLFVLGVGSEVALVSGLVSALADRYTTIKFWIFALLVCIAGFFIGLIYITPGGQWILNLVDYFGGTYVVFCLAVFEMIGIFWIYGLQNFCDDVEFMTDRKVTVYWRLCWTIITPGLMAVMFIYSLVSMTTIQYSGWDYPESAIIAGWLVFVFGLIQFPLWAFWAITHNCNQGFLAAVKKLLKPSEEWGPADPENRANWKLFKANKVEERRKAKDSNKISFAMQKFSNLIGRTK
ncbi:hypothetical protein ACFFRR_002227 [Megaselia abdita]